MFMLIFGGFCFLSLIPFGFFSSTDFFNLCFIKIPFGFFLIKQLFETIICKNENEKYHPPQIPDSQQLTKIQKTTPAGNSIRQ